MAPTPRGPRWRLPQPRPERPPKDPQEARYVEALVEKYAAARREHGRLPKGVFTMLAEEAQKEHGLEGAACADLPLLKLEQKVRFQYLRRLKQAGEDVPKHRNDAIFEEVYARYAREFTRIVFCQYVIAT